MYVETERERERERLQRISEHENKKGGSSPLCVYNIRESESVCESEKESKSRANEFLASVCVFLFFLTLDFYYFASRASKKKRTV